MSHAHALLSSNGQQELASGFDRRALLTGNPWDQIAEEIRALSRRPEDWDGAGAASAQQSSVDGALRFCEIARGKEPVPTCVSMTRDGAILLEWHAHGAYREFEFVDGQHFESMVVPKGREALHVLYRF